MADVNLAQVFDFTDADLQANRAGRLSPRQQAMLTAHLREATAAYTAAKITAVPVVLLIIGYFVLIPPLADRLGPLTCLIIPVVILALMRVGLGLWRKTSELVAQRMQNASFGRWVRQRMTGYAEKAARIETGQVSVQQGLLRRVSDGEHEHLYLGDIELQNSSDAEQDEHLQQLTPGQRYAIYRVTGTDWIIAVERVD